MTVHRLTSRRTLARLTGGLTSIAALTSLSACGAASTAKPTAHSTTCVPSTTGDPLATAPFARQPVDPAMAAQVPSAEKGKTLVFGVAPDLPPVNFTDGTDQRGFEPDLLRAAAQRAGVSVTFRKLTNPLGAYTAGQLDGIAGFLNDTPERQKIGTFVDYLNASPSVVVRGCNSAGIHQAEDLCGKKIAAAVGTVQLAQVTDKNTPGSLLALCAKAGRPAPIPVEAQTSVDAVTTVSAGRADALVIDAAIAVGVTQASNAKLTVAYTDTLQNSPVGIVLAPQHAPLAPVLAKAYQSLVDDGTYQRILAGYGTTTGALKTITVNGGGAR